MDVHETETVEELLGSHVVYVMRVVYPLDFTAITYTKSELPGGVRRRATPDPIKSLISQTPLISCRSTRRFQISSNLISPPWGKFDFCVCLWLYQHQPDDGLSCLLLSLSLIFLASSITLGAFKTAQFASPATVYSEDD